MNYTVSGYRRVLVRRSDGEALNTWLRMEYYRKSRWSLHLFYLHFHTHCTTHLCLVFLCTQLKEFRRTFHKFEPVYNPGSQWPLRELFSLTQDTPSNVWLVNNEAAAHRWVIPVLPLLDSSMQYILAWCLLLVMTFPLLNSVMQVLQEMLIQRQIQKMSVDIFRNLLKFIIFFYVFFFFICMALPDDPAMIFFIQALSVIG